MEQIRCRACRSFRDGNRDERECEEQADPYEPDDRPHPPQQIQNDRARDEDQDYPQHAAKRRCRHAHDRRLGDGRAVAVACARLP